MTKLKTRLPVKAVAVLMTILMIFSTISIMFTVSAAAGGGNGEWYTTNGTLSVYGQTTNSMGTRLNSASNQNIQYAVYLPEGYEDYADRPDGKKLAYMLVLSGGSNTLNTAYDSMAKCSGLNYLADEKGIVLVYFRQGNTTINPGYYWNFFTSSYQTRSDSYVMGQIINRFKTIKNDINEDYGEIIDDKSAGRTYLAGMSAGGAFSACFLGAYPDEFDGACIIAGLPYKILGDSTWSNYSAAMTNSYAYNWTRPNQTTLNNNVINSWNSISGFNKDTDAPRVIVFHGTSDEKVVIQNGNEIAIANADAMGFTDKTSETVGNLYTVDYYGLNDSTMGDVNTDNGYSKARSSRLAYYKMQGVAHYWIQDNPVSTSTDDTRNFYAKSNDNYSYNDLMWEFFEGDPSYNDADAPTTPADEQELYASYGARFCVQNGLTFADLVTSTGLQVTNLPLSPDYLEVDTDASTASEWAFNFNLSQMIADKKATITDPRYEVCIESISVYQNVWATSTGGATVNFGYSTVINDEIVAGGANAVSVSSATKLASWTTANAMKTGQLVGTITDKNTLNALASGAHLSIITYGENGTPNFNVAAPIISVKLGTRNANANVQVPGDGVTKTSNKIFPVFAYNSAAGYDAPDTSKETMSYNGSASSLLKGTAGHLTASTQKYAVGVYNAGDNNDKIYYSFNLEDYTRGNGYSIQSITIDYVLEGNPYFSKEDVGVKVSALGDVYWDEAGSQPTDGYTTLENFTLSKGEKIEGQIVLDYKNNNHRGIINHVNNLYGFTLVFENTSSNEHYYFLSYMPTITVNYENVPNTPSNPISGIGTRVDTSYGDLVDDGSLFEEGTTTVTGTHVINSVTASNPKYDNNNSDASSANSNITNTSSRYRTTFGAYQVYSDAVKQDIINSIKAQFPGMTEGVDYWIKGLDVKLASANVAISAAKSSNSYNQTGYGYVYYHPTAQSGSTAAFATTDGTGPILTVNITANNQNAVNGNDNFEPNMEVTTKSPYLWLKSYGSTYTTSSMYGGSTTHYVSTSLPALTNVQLSYSATVTMTPPSYEYEEGKDVTINSVTASGPLGYTQATSSAGTQQLSTNNTATLTANNYYATVAGFDLYNAAYNKVISELKLKYGDDVESKMSDLKITFTEVTASINAYESRYNNTDPTASIRYSRPSDASAYNNRGTFTTNSTGTTVNWTVKSNTTNQTNPYTTTITLDDNHQFTEDNPYMLIRAYTNRTGYNNSSYNYAMLNVPTLSNLVFSWSATIETDGEGGGSTTPGLPEQPEQPDLPTYEPNDGGYVRVDVPMDSDAKGSGSTKLEFKENNSAYVRNSAYSENSSKSNWYEFTGYTNQAIYGYFLSYDIYSEYSKLQAYNTALAKYKDMYPASEGYRVTGTIVATLTVSGTAAGATEKTLYATAGPTQYADAYNSAMKASGAKTFNTTAELDYTATLTDFPEITETNRYLTLYYGCGTNSTNTRFTSLPNVVYAYNYEIYVEKQLNPIASASAETNTTDRTVTVTVETTGPFTNVKLDNGANVHVSTESVVKENGNRVHTIVFEAPVNDTTYTVYAAKDDGVYNSYTMTCTVTGAGEVPPPPEEPDEPIEDVVTHAGGNKLTNIVNGSAYKIEDEYYDEVRQVSTSYSTPVNEKLYPLNGYIVGTNSRYYTNNSSDYWTGPNRSTGSPQANVALDTKKTNFPVSYLGYAYMNYDVSKYFGYETPKTLVSDNTNNPEVVVGDAGVTSTIITKVYTETVVSSIRINSVKAQEGYTGGWANRYTVTGETWVAGGSAWNSTNRPSSYQKVGGGDVTSTMGTIGASTNLNDAQLAAAKNGGYVTVWVNNTGCDWSSYYYPSAWLLVEMPTVTVTYKTITYTDKIITETKKVTQATASTSSAKQTGTTTLSQNNAENGYLYGSDSTYDAGSNYYRTGTTEDTRNYSADTNVNMTNASLQNGNFAVVYLGKAFADYDLSSAIQPDGISSRVVSTRTTTGIINGKETEVIEEVIEWTDKRIKGIRVEGTVQAGFIGNNSAANNYYIINKFYVGVFDNWSGSSYPNVDSADWTHVNTISNIKIATQDLKINITNETYPDLYAKLLDSKRLTIRVDNTENNWSENYFGENLKRAAWTLVALPNITVDYETITWTETKLTATQAPDKFSPEYQVYAQYRFTDADGETFSKTKELGTMEGYGAYGTVTPYNVENGSTLGTVNALFANPLTDSAKPSHSVTISEDEARINQYYVLKRAYIEDTGMDVATITDNGNGTYRLQTILSADEIKTNDLYRIRVIFEYECTAQEIIDESKLVKVNLHSVFENYDANGNKIETVGQVNKTAFAKLTDLSYVLSLDATTIPYGDIVVSGNNVSAIAGSNRIYTLDVDKTAVMLNSSSSSKTGTNEFSAPNYDAKAYLDITGDTPTLGDVLLVTYNGDASTAGGTIDVYLYYKATPQYDVTINYEFDVVDENGNSVATQKFTYNELFPLSVGDVIFPYDALSTETVDRTSVSIQLNGENEPRTYRVGEFGEPEITASAGIEYNEDTLVITDINAKGTITFKYKLVASTLTNTDVKHKYVVKYGGEEIGSIFLTTDEDIPLNAPGSGSIAAKLDDSEVPVVGAGSFRALQFTPVRVETDVDGLTFGSYADGAFAATAVPYDMPEATVTIVYELETRKLTINENFLLNGAPVGETEQTIIYVAANMALEFTSDFDADYEPNNDGVKLSEYTASSSDVVLSSDKGGNVRFSLVARNDMVVNIDYNYATFAQAPLNVVHQFYKNGVLVGTKTESGVTTLTNDPDGTRSYTVIPYSGTVNGISGSISSAIVDANNYYANGMSSANGNVSVSGYTVSYTNNDATGTQPAIDVIVRYDIDDTADVTVDHKFYINEVEVDADVTNAPTSSLTLTTGSSQAITAAQGTANYNGTIFNLSDFTKTASTTSAGFSVDGLNVALNTYNTADGKVTVRYDLTVRTITVKEIFKTSTSTLGTETSKLYVADGESYKFESKYDTTYPVDDGIAITNFSREISGGYTLGAGIPATFTSTATADDEVTITYTVGTQAEVDVIHKYYINGQPMSAVLTNEPTESLILNKGVSKTITLAQGTVNFNGTQFNLSDFTPVINPSNGIAIEGTTATLTEFNVATGTVTIEYSLTVYTVTVTEIFAKDAVTVETATKTAYVKAGGTYDSFESDYKTGSIISNVALGDYIRTAEGANVTTAANGAATFVLENVRATTNVTINYAVSTKTTADVEYVYIVNGVEVPTSAFVNYSQGASEMNLVYGQAVSAPSSTGTYILGTDSYSIAADFKKTVSVSGAATVANNDVILNGYNVDNGDITVTVTYEITISNEAPAKVYHTYYINGTELTGDAIANVTTGTTDLNLEYGISQTINKSTGAVIYNGTEFDLSQFDVSVSYSDALSMNGLDVTLIKHNVGLQNVTLRYDLTVYTVVVNEVFFINGIEQTGDAVSKTYYVSAKYPALTAELVNGSKTVNGIAVSNFIASASDNSDAIDGVIAAGNYVATVNGNGVVTVEYNVSTKTNVNITSIFKVNGSTDGVDISNVTNATATQVGFEYGVSTPVTSLAGGYVIWNGTQFNVSDFTASITDYDVTTIAASGLNVTVNKYNTDATNIVITYTINVVSITLTENFIVDGDTVETQVTTKWYPLNSDYTFVSDYGNDYVPAGTTIALSNFTVYGGEKNSNGFVEFTGTAADDATFDVNYVVTTKAIANVIHKYFFNGEEITPVITTQGASLINLTYGVSTPIALAEGTYEFNGKIFNLSDADITVTSSNGLVNVDGANVTLNAYNQTATDITVRYDLSTVVVNITETVVTDNGAHSVVVGTQSIYLLEGEAFEFISTHAPSDTIVVNGVTIPYSLFTKTVTGAEGFAVDTSSNVTISGTMEGKKADIEIVYSGVKTTATVTLYQRYHYRNSGVGTGTSVNGHYYVTIPGFALNVGDRIALSNKNDDLTFTVKGVTLTVNTTYFEMKSLKANGIDGHVEGNEFVIDYIAPNTTENTKIDIYYCLDLFANVEVVHEFYINGKLANEATINETAENVVVAAPSGYTGNYLISQKTSGTVTVGGTKYNIADFTVDDALITTTGLTIKRVTASGYTNRFAVQSYDYSTDERTVVIRYDLTTTLEEVETTVNSNYVNNGEFVGSISSSVVTNLKIGDVIANDTVKTINGIEVTFAVQSVVGNGVTITEENGVYTITEISPKATEWSIDITYVATAIANVKLTHNFYVAGKLIGTITDNTVIVNLANHSGKFVALNGIVGVTTDKGIVFVDANRFTVTLANGSEYGTFADDIFTLNADALNGSTYEITFDYNVDGISYAIDGEVGVKQTASATNVDRQYNVVTTVNSIGNIKPVDIIFVVDVSKGAGDTSNQRLTNAKAEISEYITNSFAVNNNVRVAIVTYADGYEVLTGGYITDKDTALATVAGITLAEAKDGYDVTTSNLQAGLYGTRMLMNADARRAYTDVIVFKGSEPNAAYSKYNDASYNYSAKADATADVANAAANYELDKMNASKEIVIDLANAETNVDATMTEIFDARNYINVNGKLSITVNSDEFTFVEANGVTVNDNAVEYTYENGVLTVDLGTLKGATEIEYTLELTNKVEGDYFVSDEIKVTYTDSIDEAVETRYGVSARVSYSTTVTGATITVITYYANSDLKPVGMDGLTVKNFYEDAILGKPVVYTISGVTNLTAGNTYTVKAPIVAGYSLWANEQSTKTVEIPAEGQNAVVYFGYYADGSLVDDSIVYDEATDIVFDVLDNDTRPSGEGFDVIYGIGATEKDAMEGNKEIVSTTFGELVILSGGKVKFTPKGITVTGELYYAVKDGDDIRVATIYVVPATIVKADSSDNTQITAGDRWQLVDEDGNVVDGAGNVSNKKPNSADDIYGGYENDYANNFGFDGGDSLYANRYQDYLAYGKVDGTDAQYTSTFTFTGTGFDIISVTGNKNGYVTIKTWDSAGNLVSKASGNMSTFALTDKIYQATIFTCTDLTLDTYTVEVIALRTYLPIIGMTDTQVYVDSVRTYNPFVNKTNEHYNDLNNGSKTETLKDIFVDGKLAVSTGGNGLFTQSGNLDINSYMDKGTNNAINIIGGQSLLFKLVSASVRTTFQVEMAAVGGSATVEVYVNSKLVETLTVDTGVFAYYDFSSYIRVDSTINFEVKTGEVTFTKVRYNDAVLSDDVDGEKYTTDDLAYGTAPDGELLSDDYTVNTARLVKRSGTSRTITALVYTSTNAESVIIYTSGYRIAPTSVTKQENSSGTQNQFLVTYTLPDDVPTGEVAIDFYAYANNTYSSDYKSATYKLS